MSASYILSFDQSTQGTKGFLLNEEGKIIASAFLSHKQIYDSNGNLFHDLNEIYANLLKVAKEVIFKGKIDSKLVKGIAIANQRETSCLFSSEGLPITEAVVWKNTISKPLVDQLTAYQEEIHLKTGLWLSPFYPASKYAWLKQANKENERLLEENKAHLGTIDSYLICRLTKGKVFKTDVTNASRTSLMDLKTLKYDEQLCSYFGLKSSYLPEIDFSDGDFGMTDLDGALNHEVPILSVMGDSHAAFYGHGCYQVGEGKATYGTGSSVMVNIGNSPLLSSFGLNSSIGFAENGKVCYVLEGNINCTGGVITWLKDRLHLIKEPKEAESLALKAQQDSKVYLVPAFNGLNAPYNNSSASALLIGLKENTGVEEICKAALDSIAYQIQDVISSIEKDLGKKITALGVDGGPSSNRYLMQLQSDLSSLRIIVPQEKEMTGKGVGLMALKNSGF
ncbi:MAG: FGGY family carbohydrate kinase [Bacilli bacterium]|jgi:glycerol kinase|nr:FGGY family carbohydrate kinase [Bacilli bacterium]